MVGHPTIVQETVVPKNETVVPKNRASNRVALVIGNSKYQHANELSAPTRDASAVADALSRLGFDVILGLDLEKAGMEAAAARFSQLVREADTGLVYFSGHGMQFAGSNYLMPTDTQFDDLADLKWMFSVDTITPALAQAKKLRILILDACRTNPFVNTGRQAGAAGDAELPSGLANLKNPRGMVVAYASQAGQTADDGNRGNSVYTASLLHHLETGEEIATIFREAMSDTFSATGERQLPELSLSITQDFFLGSSADNTSGKITVFDNHVRATVETASLNSGMIARNLPPQSISFNLHMNSTSTMTFLGSGKTQTDDFVTDMRKGNVFRFGTGGVTFDGQPDSPGLYTIPCGQDRMNYSNSYPRTNNFDVSMGCKYRSFNDGRYLLEVITVVGPSRTFYNFDIQRNRDSCTIRSGSKKYLALVGKMTYNYLATMLDGTCYIL